VELHRTSGQFRLAILELERVAKLTPKDPDPLVLAGDVSLQEGDTLGALTYYQRALTLAPERVELLFKVQELLQVGAGGGANGMPGMTPRPSGMPGLPNPMRSLMPPMYDSDPLNPRRRR
jgi:tetratricopeptide (TPR) repeat protein